MNKGLTFLAILAVALLVALGLGGSELLGSTSAAVQSYTLDWSVLGGGGSAGSPLDSTIGQVGVGWSTGAHLVGSGFWYGVGATGYQVYLPLALKN